MTPMRRWGSRSSDSAFDRTGGEGKLRLEYAVVATYSPLRHFVEQVVGGQDIIELTKLLTINFINVVITRH